METQQILVVEDENIIRSALCKLLQRRGYQVSEARTIREAVQNFSLDSFDLIISDLRLPGAPGTDLIGLAGEVPVLIMTSYASLRSAVESMRLGAVDYIAKPFDHDDMLTAVERIISARQKKAGNTSPAQGSVTTIEGMIGNSELMKGLYLQIEKVAPTSATVLVQGETGTGKELVARSIHLSSQRSDKPLISVNCAAIPETLIEAELFGHEKGAFTGAASSREGLVAAADGGTLFLDEIGELPLEAQARLLRVLQEGEVRPIGSIHDRKVDVRLIAATHRNLRQLCAQGRFREDLYYRLNVIQINLPPLRERGKDVIMLADHLLKKFSAEVGKEGLHFSPECIQLITSYNWPGNVRELENAVQRAVILCDEQEIHHQLLGIDLELRPIEQPPVAALVSPQGELATLSNNPYTPPKLTSYFEEGKNRQLEPSEDLSLEDYFQRFVLEHQEKMTETELARKLGISRKCLWERRQKLGIPRSKSKS